MCDVYVIVDDRTDNNHTRDIFRLLALLWRYDNYTTILLVHKCDFFFIIREYSGHMRTENARRMFRSAYASVQSQHALLISNTKRTVIYIYDIWKKNNQQLLESTKGLK